MKALEVVRPVLWAGVYGKAAPSRQPKQTPHRTFLPALLLPFLFGLSALLVFSFPRLALSQNCAIKKIIVSHKYETLCQSPYAGLCYTACAHEGCTSEERRPCCRSKHFYYVFDCEGNLRGISSTGNIGCWSCEQDPDHKIGAIEDYFTCAECAGREPMDRNCGCRRNAPVVCPGEPINIVRGNMLHELPLFSTNLPGPQFGLTLTYDSKKESATSVGYGWEHT